ncbi:MAG: hypothetical protein QM478_06460 [Flavobacteriaceae bacterium]
MEKGTHGIDELKFSELDYVGQARSLNAQILGLERALNAHFTRGEKESKNIIEAKEKYMLQLQRLLKGLE